MTENRDSTGTDEHPFPKKMLAGCDLSANMTMFRLDYQQIVTVCESWWYTQIFPYLRNNTLGFIGWRFHTSSLKNSWRRVNLLRFNGTECCWVDSFKLLIEDDDSGIIAHGAVAVKLALDMLIVMTCQIS